MEPLDLLADTVDHGLALMGQTGHVAGPSHALPEGIVAFLLTDVEGSTQLWETRDATEMGGAIARHYGILDHAITEAGGVRPVEQGEGDSVVAAFSSCTQALRAAVTAQRELLRELPWLRVRMAIHAGDAQLRDEGNYVGRTVIRCARIRGCGHGGQILLSSTAAALVIDDLDADVSLVDLGSVRLRGIARPERIWQVGHAELPSTFPSLRTVDETVDHLPTPTSTFVGRDDELAAVVDLLRSERLVTLTGSGGCGKTRLAVHAASAARAHFAGGVHWVELAAITEGRAVSEPIAAAIGIAAGSVRELPGALASVLHERGSTLLVLDNAEHLIDDVAHLVQAMSRACLNLTLLVTSREALGVVEERLFRVPSLGAPPLGATIAPAQLDAYPAVRLFVDRARRARPNLVIDERTAPTIAAICARLDGIPLALELAAARARTMPLDRLAAGLDDAFRLLTGGARTSVPRQQTLLASIGWSVDLLDDTERAVLRRLSVFKGPFALDAAEAVASGGVVDEFDLLDVAGRLVDKSLVLLDEESGRYRLLETIRQYAFERLQEAGEVASTRDRHCTFHARFAETLGSSTHGAVAAEDAVWLPDVLAALDWGYDHSPDDVYRITTGLAWHHAAFGYYEHLAAQYEWVVARQDHGNPAWARAVAALAYVAWLLQRTDYLAVIEPLTPLLDPDDDESRLQIAIYRATLAAVIVGDGSLLEPLLEEALQTDHPHLLGYVASTLAVHQSRVGRLGRVDELVESLLDQSRRHRRRHHLLVASTAVGSLSLAHYERGRFAEAVALIADATGTTPVTRVINAGANALLAHATGDVALLERARHQQAGVEVSALMRNSVLFVPAFDALIRQDWVEAAELAAGSYHSNPLAPPLRSFMLRPLVIAHLALDRIEELTPVLAEFRAAVDALDEPLPTAHRRHIDALIARHLGDTESVTRSALDLGTVALDQGYALLAVDALELLADAAVRRQNAVTAARLFGAVEHERARLGYVGRFLPDPAELVRVADDLRVTQPEAFAEGGALTVDEALGLAGRARGARGRPTHGWAGLTPTELRVVELVSEGLPNDKVATQLLMSVATVKTHLTHAYAKTATANRTELAAEYRRQLDRTA